MQRISDAASVFVKLTNVTSLKFTAASNRDTGWIGTGVGTVNVVSPADGSLIFEEFGTWTNQENLPLRFHNTFRWSRLNDKALRLEHLRLGLDQPVHLFDLRWQTNSLLATSQPHVCGSDLYSANLRILGSEIFLDWTVTGPRKDEKINYVYSL